MHFWRRVQLVFVFMLALPAVTHAATLKFGGPTAVSVGDMVSIPVLLSTDTGESANAVSATVSYSTDLLTLVSISKAQSIITLWAQEPTITGGNAQLEGVILNPGWSGKAGIVATLVFQVKAKGTATVTYADADVYANDGKATPILSNAPSKYVTIKEAAPGATTVPAGTSHATSSIATTSQPETTVEPASTTPPLPAPLSLAQRIKNYALPYLPYVPYMLAAILLLLLIAFVIRKIGQIFGGVRSYKKLKKDSVQGTIHEHFHELRDAVAKEMLVFQKAKTKRQLTEEEEKFLERFKKLLDKTEKSIEKEISK